MKNTNSKDKNYEKALDAWKNLSAIHSQQYVQSRVMHCLPKHKLKLHNRILGQIIAKRFNATAIFDKAFKKLNPIEQGLLRAQVYV